MGRIEAAFVRARERGTPALIPFLTAGDPDLAASVEIVLSLAAAGADLIELGFPFSDPMADGPTIQAASERALANGATLSGVVDVVRNVRRQSEVPIVLMGYFNPIFVYGVERFCRDAAAAGVDGLLLVDLPPEESDEILAFSRAVGLRLITLIAPTTPDERRKTLAAAAEGYLYYVSMTGVTGSQTVDPAAIAADVERLKAVSSVPVAVGFGITTPEDAAAIGAYADGVVIGSALVREIAENSQEGAPAAARFLGRIRSALDRKGAA